MKGEARHWVRLGTACNNRCLFCLDADTPRDLILPVAELRDAIARGRRERGAARLVLSGGEPTLHPDFIELVGFGRQQGYERVQVVTNGHRFAERAFFEATMDAGLGEITFSLHGPNPEVHDRLTGRPGAFKALMKGLVRAVRDGRPIVNVDVVINRQNVARLDEIIELCVSQGVTEFDLLHLIPQGRAFEHRDSLFYEVADHLPKLREVFRLARHPRITVWTNRFPVAYLEGLEDLIQDPDKLRDEVHGRRYQLRRYLDTGEPLDCRSAERCPHCFIEPFCTTMDRAVAAMNDRAFEVWWVGAGTWSGEALPYGCSRLGVAADTLAALHDMEIPPGTGIYAVGVAGDPLADAAGGKRPTTLVAAEPAQLDGWLVGELPPNITVDIHLNRRTATWLTAHRDRLRAAPLTALRIHQPTHASLTVAQAEDVADLRGFFRALDLPIAVSGLPACLAPGAELVPARAILPAQLFDATTGRLDLAELARHHLATAYHVQSVRCADCPVASRCDGAHIQLVRNLGLAVLQPLGAGPEAEATVGAVKRHFPEPRSRLATGRPPEPPAPSLPGYGPPPPPPSDPLARHAAEPQSEPDETSRD